MELIRLAEADIGALSLLIADFRVTLQAYKGRSSQPDIEAAGEEAREFF